MAVMSYSAYGRLVAYLSETSGIDAAPPDGQGHATTEGAGADRAEQARLTRQLEEATTRYREASGARDREAKRTALADMRAYRKRILELGEAVKARHGGMLPAWWNE